MVQRLEGEMPTTLFHVAIGLLIAVAVLGDDMDKRALFVVAALVALPDLDAFLSIWFPGAHRSYLHNVFVFLVPGAFLLVLRGTPYMERMRTGWPDVERVLWVALFTMAVAGIGLDAVASGVNLFYPVHDQYYQLQGNVHYSSQHGLTQSVTDVERARIGSSQEVYYASGVDPVPGPEPQHVERTFPIFENTLQILLSLSAFGAVAYRVREKKTKRSRRRKRLVLPYTAVQRE